jgi:HSP20 family protein
MKMDDIRQGVGAWWNSVADGWDRLRRSASSALTRFRPGDKTALPAAEIVDDSLYLPGQGWAMLGGDVFEDDRRIVVRLEAPGLAKDDFDVQVLGDALVVRGEKRFERESSEGRWRVLQCAYGSFHRSIPLPVAVQADRARASYRNGVLRVELPKAEPGRPRVVSVKVG